MSGMDSGRQVSATLVAWDVRSFRNMVRLPDGTDLDNLPVASGVEALTYRPGDRVLLLDAAGSYFLTGRLL